MRRATGYEIGIISIGIGIAVGRAVRWGSNNRGGWAYQLLAVFLTYAAVAGNYMPDVVQALNEKSDAATQSQNNGHDQSTTTPKAAKAQEEPLTLGTAVLGVLALFLIAATAPFMAGTSNIIGLLIIAFGLFEAWKINKRVAITMSGPFSVTPVAPPSPDV